MHIHGLKIAAATKALLILLAFAGTAAAQGNANTNDKRLPKEDPELYSAFFYFMEDMSGWLDARTTAVPAKKDQLTASVARYLKVDAKDLPKIAAICRSVTTSLRKIDADAHEFWADQIGKKQRPDAATLRVSAAQRTAALQSAIDQLSHTLSPASWSGLQNHINTEHRNSVTRAFLSSSGPAH